MFIHNLARSIVVSAMFASISAMVMDAGDVRAAPAPVDKGVTGPLVSVISADSGPQALALREGIQEGLRRAGYTPGKNMRWQAQDASGDSTRIASVAEQAVRERPRVIVALGASVARAVGAATREVPVVYSAVSDPTAAGLANASDAAPGNITGVSDALELARQIDLIRAVAPQARRVGIVYDPQNPDSLAVVKQLQALLPKVGMTLVEAAASRAADVGPAARSLIEKADVFYSGIDRRVRAGYPALVRVAEDSRIPLIAGDVDAVALGAVAAIGVSYREIGAQTGLMVARVLKGEAPGQIKPQGAGRLTLHINPQAAQRQGATLSDALLKSAAQVIRP